MILGIKSVEKRDGSIVEFNREKITKAIESAIKQVEDGDITEANKLTDIVVSRLAEMEYKIPNVEDIQDIVEKVLIEEGHAETAKKYILFRADRDRIRNMNNSLMRTFEELTFGSSNDVELKRENANIDGNTAMGTMLRYGSEGAKAFNLSYLVAPNHSRAHKNGDIHIHDLDFLALTETCLVANSKVVLRQGRRGEPFEVDINYFDKYLENTDIDTVVNIENDKLYVYDNGKFTAIKNCVRHSSSNKRVYRIHSEAATIEVTDNHVVPVRESLNGIYNTVEVSVAELIEMRKDNEELYFVPSAFNGEHIKYGDFSGEQYRIDSIEEIEYNGYVYDIETTSHRFMTNGVRVHNCCQIDLEKLFKNGFNTGHGTLREPGEIRSYAALACIAIQANQNEQHKLVA